LTSCVCSKEVTACFTSESAAIRLPVRCFLRGPKNGHYFVSWRQLNCCKHYSWDVREHPFYRPDLTLSDFHFFGPRKENLVGTRFATDADSKQAVTLLLTLDTDLFYDGIQTLVPQWGTCLNVSDWLCEYLMCTTCYPCTKCTSKSEESSHNGCLLPSFWNLLIIFHDCNIRWIKNKTDVCMSDETSRHWNYV